MVDDDLTGGLLHMDALVDTGIDYTHPKLSAKVLGATTLVMIMLIDD